MRCISRQQCCLCLNAWATRAYAVLNHPLRSSLPLKKIVSLCAQAFLTLLPGVLGFFEGPALRAGPAFVPAAPRAASTPIVQRPLPAAAVARSQRSDVAAIRAAVMEPVSTSSSCLLYTSPSPRDS